VKIINKIRITTHIFTKIYIIISVLQIESTKNVSYQIFYMK